MFDTVPISVGFVSEIEMVASASVLERVAVIDEEDRILDLVILAKFPKEEPHEAIVYHGTQIHMQEIVCLGIDCSVQPVFLTAEPDHRLVDRDVIW